MNYTIRTDSEMGSPAWESSFFIPFGGEVSADGARWWLLSQPFGAVAKALGATGPAATAARAGMTFSAAQAIDSAGDLAAGRSDWGEFFKDVEQAGKMGLTTDVLMTALGSILNALSMRNAPNGQLPLVPVQSTNRSLAPAGGQSSLPELPDIVQGTGMTNSELLGLAQALAKDNEEKLLDEAFERGFDEEFQEPIDPYEKVRYNQNRTIVVTDDLTKQGHQSIPKYYKPNAVVDIISHGTQHDRIIYDENGCFMTFIHGGDHGQPKYHQYGYHGEHAHDLVFDAATGKLIEKTDRELTDIERIQNADIIWGGETMTLEHFAEVLSYSEPDFGYHGKWYTICWPRGLFPDADYLVTAFYGPEDEFPVFHGFDDLLDNCIIEGKSLRQILPDIEI